MLYWFYYSKKDAVDIDRFAEYNKLVEKILKEEPSKLMVYVDLQDMKTRAKVCNPGDSSLIFSLVVVSAKEVVQIQAVMMGIQTRKVTMCVNSILFSLPL